MMETIDAITTTRHIFPRLAGNLIKVALVEDKANAEQDWCAIVNSFPNFTCVCSCSSAEEALITIPIKNPDIVLMDIFLPRSSGIQCTTLLKQKLPQLQIIMFTAMDSQELFFMALEAGADGYLLKRTKPADLRRALLDVSNGGAPITGQVARQLVESFRKDPKRSVPAINLSTREEQILRLVSKGLSNKMIADALQIGAATVSSHLKRAFKKLQVRSRTEAAVRYMNS